MNNTDHFGTETTVWKHIDRHFRAISNGNTTRICKRHVRAHLQLRWVIQLNEWLAILHAATDHPWHCEARHDHASDRRTDFGSFQDQRAHGSFCIGAFLSGAHGVNTNLQSGNFASAGGAARNQARLSGKFILHFESLRTGFCQCCLRQTDADALLFIIHFHQHLTGLDALTFQYEDGANHTRRERRNHDCERRWLDPPWRLYGSAFALHGWFRGRVVAVRGSASCSACACAQRNRNNINRWNWDE